MIHLSPYFYFNWALINIFEILFSLGNSDVNRIQKDVRSEKMLEDLDKIRNDKRNQAQSGNDHMLTIMISYDVF